MKRFVDTIILVGFFFCFIPMFSYSQDTIRVACVGNSITEGNALGNKLLDAYPVALGRYLGSGYLVKNCGVSGRTMLKKGDFPIWNEALFSQALSFNPNIVTIMLGTNDSKPYNWIHKDEFMKDYYAMIDTFKQLSSQPEIYICLPLPSFSDAFDIRDSVIVADIIPMIQQIADSTNVKLVDFNTPFLDKSSLMPDGIHPLVAGSDLIARIFYKELTGNQIDTLKEDNVALNEPAFQGTNVLPELTDGNSTATVGLASSGQPVIIGLQNQNEVDMIRINFTDSLWSSVSFTLALSADSLVWTPVTDTTVADTLLLMEKKIRKFIKTFNPLTAKFIKFQINNGNAPADTVVFVNQIEVFEKRAVHAPVLGWKFVSQTTQNIRVQLFSQRVTNKNEIMRIYRQSVDGGSYAILYNYGAAIPANLLVNIPVGAVNRFYGTVYSNGAEIVSDTLAIVGEKVTSVNADAREFIPAGFALLQNYPNPFNPATIIGYYLPYRSQVQLKIFDMLGRELETLVDEELPSGTHKVDFNASKLPSGLYFYRMQAAGFTATKKLVVLK